jgi:hypothetical protein
LKRVAHWRPAPGWEHGFRICHWILLLCASRLVVPRLSPRFLFSTLVLLLRLSFESVSNSSKFQRLKGLQSRSP